MALVNSDLLSISIFAVIAVLGVAVILRFVKDKTKRVSTLRLFIQTIAVFGMFFGLVIGPFSTSIMLPLGIAPRDRLITDNVFGLSLPDGIPVPGLSCYFASGRTVTCPIWQIQAYIFPLWNTGSGYFAFYSTPGIERLALVMGVVAVLSLAVGRFFCGWLCPFGLYMDLLILARKVAGKKHLNFSEKTNNALSQLGYVMIAVCLVLSVIFGSQAILGITLIPGTGSFPYNIGEGGFITNYFQAPFCLICPMRPLCTLVECALGYMNFSYVTNLLANFGGFLYMLGWYFNSLNLTILILVSIAAFAFRRFWCRICPLGGITALFSAYAPFKWVALTRLEKDEVKCTRCGICKRVCPTQVTEVYEEKGGNVTAPKCILCARCVEMCPHKDALRITVVRRSVFNSRNWLEP
jgi:polyferredoxin